MPPAENLEKHVRHVRPRQKDDDITELRACCLLVVANCGKFTLRDFAKLKKTVEIRL